MFNTKFVSTQSDKLRSFQLSFVWPLYILYGSFAWPLYILYYKLTYFLKP